MKYINLKSSNIDSVAYDSAKRTLHVRFVNAFGKVYVYKGVPQSKYIGLLRAGSKGVYFSAKIKDSYPYTIRRY
jgi:hypothetical protein